MKALFAAMLIVAGTFVAAGEAPAQIDPRTPTGSIIPLRPAALDPVRAGQFRKAFARCVYRGAPAKVAALLEHSDNQAVDLAGAKITDVASALNATPCMDQQVGINQSLVNLQVSNAVLRDMLAEEAYLAMNAAAPASTQPLTALTSKYVSSGDTLRRAQAMTKFTDCAVIKDLAKADALLRTIPSSHEEREAARAMAPALGGCLQAGQKVGLNAASVRAFVAYAMWNRFGRATALNANTKSLAHAQG